MNEQIEKVKTEIEFIKATFANLLKTLPSFDVVNKKLLPYGLKPHMTLKQKKQEQGQFL